MKINTSELLERAASRETSLKISDKVPEMANNHYLCPGNLQGRVKFPTGGIVREPGMQSCTKG